MADTSPRIRWGASATYLENDAPLALWPSLALRGDPERVLVGVRMRLAEGFDPAHDVLSFMPGAGITGTYDPLAGVLTLSGSATAQAYEAALRTVSYANTGDTPPRGTHRVVLQVASDGSSPEPWGREVPGRFKVVAVDDAPALDIRDVVRLPAGASALVLDPALHVTDPDSGLTGAFVTLAGAGALSFTATAAIGGSFDAGTGVLALKGVASAAEYEQVLRSVTYLPDDPATASGATITIELSDARRPRPGMHEATSVQVIAETAPVVTVPAVPATVSEDGPVVLLAPGLAVTDQDADGLAGATVRIVGFQPGDVLSFAPAGGIAGTFDAATGVLTLSGDAGTEAYAQVLRGVGLQVTGETTSRTIEWRVTDAAGHASAVALTQVDVEAANDPPALGVAASLDFTEGDAPRAIAPAATVVDPDTAAFEGGSLRVSIAQAAPADVLRVLATGEGGAVTVEGIAFAWLGLQVGTLEAGVDGELVIHLSGAGATADGVQALVRSIGFGNDADAPSAADRTVQFTLQDAAGEVATAGSVVHVTGVDDAPVLGTSSAGAVTFTENGAPLQLDGGLAITDADSDLLHGATVRITAGFGAGQDVLGFSAVAGIDAQYDAASGVLAFAGDATLDAYEALLRTVTYSNASDTPATADRTVEYRIDGGNAITRDVHVLATHDAPVVDAGTAPPYVENRPAIPILSGVGVSSIEGSAIAGATVAITGQYHPGEDVLAFSASRVITGSFDADRGVLTLAGTASAAEYEAVLHSVTYVNTSDAPSTEPRTIGLQVTDDQHAASLESAFTVTVTAVDDLPVAVVPDELDVGTAFSHTALSIAGLSLADVDGGTALASATVSAAHGTLAVDLAGGAQARGNGTGRVDITGTLAEVNAALATLGYTSDDGFTGADSVRVVPGAGGVAGPPTTFRVGVVAQVFRIDAADAHADGAGAGTAANPFNTVAAFQALAGAGRGDIIHVAGGSYDLSTTLTLADGQRLQGEGQLLQLVNPVTGEVVTIDDGAAAPPVTFTVGGATTHGIDLARDNTLDGVRIVTTQGGQVGLSDGNGTVGALTIAHASITGAGMALDIDQGGTLDAQFDTLSSSGSSQQGVQLGGMGLAGRLVATQGSISGAAGAAFLVGDGLGTPGAGGTAAISYGGDIASSGGAAAVDVQGRAAGAGNVVFAGAVDHLGGSGTGIRVNGISGGAVVFSGGAEVASGNDDAIVLTGIATGAQVRFEGAVAVDTNGGTGIRIAGSGGAIVFDSAGAGLDVDAVSGRGIVATGTGTLAISGAGNSLVTGGGPALTVTGLRFGAGGAQFESIDASGGLHAIELSGTGSEALVITGNGAAGSGGTLQDASGSAVSITDGSFRFTDVSILDAGEEGISATNLLGTNWFADGRIDGFGLRGGNIDDGIHVVNAGPSLGLLTVAGSVITGGENGNDGLFLEAQGASDMALVITGSTFDSLYGDAIQADAITGATGTMQVAIRDSHFVNAAALGNGGIALRPFGAIDFVADVSGNTFTQVMRPATTQGAISLLSGSTGQADVTIAGNTLAGIPGSRGISVTADAGTTNVLVDGNSIDALGSDSAHAISVNYLAREAATIGSGQVIVSNNLIGQAGTLWTAGPSIGANAILVLAQSGAQVLAQVVGNVVDANTGELAGLLYEVVRVRSASGASLQATVSGNDVRDTSGGHLEFDATAGSPDGGTLVLALGGNAFGTAGVVHFVEYDPAALWVASPDQAALAAANGNALVQVQGGSALYGVPAYGAQAPELPQPPLVLHLVGVQEVAGP